MIQRQAPDVSVVLLARHGQASFGADVYDRLSDLGHVQARRLGERLAVNGVTVDRVVCGRLARQRDTALDAMAALGLGAETLAVDARLDEYDHEDVLRRPGNGEASELAEAIARWAEDDGDYGETYAAFVGRVDAVIGELAAASGTTLAVTSGGPIAVTVARLLGASLDRWPALAFVTVNASLTKIVSGRSGVNLISFNDHAHLERDRESITYR